ncbi:MAG: chemotaxis protein CheW [Gammaproteobacteria bacterium]|nr:chemotaxis protein CheW [Gammaproteobacteria bacterium]
MSTEQLRCLILPFKHLSMVLPHSMVEEIIPFAVVEPLEEEKKFHMGTMSWRKGMVPLISVEALDKQDKPEIKRRTRAAVIQMGAAEQSRYIAMILSGMPKMVVMSDTDIVSESSENMPACMAVRVDLNGTDVFVPDMDAFEYIVSKHI